MACKRKHCQGNKDVSDVFGGDDDDSNISCSCSVDHCNNNRCKCFKAGKKCGRECHDSRNASNCQNKK